MKWKLAFPCCIVIVIGFVLLCFAVYYQQRVVVFNEFLSTMEGKSIPRMHYHFYDSLQTTISMLATIGIILCVVGGFLLFLPRKMILSLLLLIVILLSSLPTIAYGTPEMERWYAKLTLQQPRDAIGIGGHVYVYDNDLSSRNTNAFVAFWLTVIRVDTVYMRIEWLEAGYFENQSGFYIFGGSWIEETYTVNVKTGIAGEGTNGEWSLLLEMWISDSIARAYICQERVMEVTFTIGGDNYCEAGSESNDVFNSLNGHYADLTYSDEETGYIWQDVESFADSPYYVSMVSSNEFFTGGGYEEVTPGRKGGYLTMQDECKH